MICESKLNVQKKILKQFAGRGHFDMIALPNVSELLADDSWKDFFAQQLLLLLRVHGITHALLIEDPAKTTSAGKFLRALIRDFKIPISTDSFAVENEGSAPCLEARFECADFRLHPSRILRLKEVECHRITTPGAISIFESHPRLAEEILFTLTNQGVNRVGLRTHDNCARFPHHGFHEHVRDMKAVASHVARRCPELKLSLGHTRISPSINDEYETDIVHPQW